MKTKTLPKQQKNIVNGVDVSQIMTVIDHIESDPEYAQFQWRVSNKWIDGGLSRSCIKGFYAGNTEDMTRGKAFIVDADEPAIVAGMDTAPNSMEYILHALASCLTGTLAYHAAVRGIEIKEVESSVVGDMNVQGLLGLEKDVRRGFNKVVVNMRVKSKASIEELTELAMFSPVYDIISNSLPVDFFLTTY